MCLYAAAGKAVLPTAPPIMIADVVTWFSRAWQDAPWFAQKRVLTPVFEGGFPATLPPVGGAGIARSDSGDL